MLTFITGLKTFVDNNTDMKLNGAFFGGTHQIPDKIAQIENKLIIKVQDKKLSTESEMTSTASL